MQEMQVQSLGLEDPLEEEPSEDTEASEKLALWHLDLGRPAPRQRLGPCEPLPKPAGLLEGACGLHNSAPTESHPSPAPRRMPGREAWQQRKAVCVELTEPALCSLRSRAISGASRGQFLCVRFQSLISTSAAARQKGMLLREFAWFEKTFIYPNSSDTNILCWVQKRETLRQPCSQVAVHID